MTETRKRSIVKAIIYRIICISLSIIIPYIISRDWEFSISFGAMYSIILIIVYYTYERIWNIVEWGKA